MKKIIMFLVLGLFLVGFVFAVQNAGINQLQKGNDKFCGTSTEGACEGDGDCVTDGCSGQICRAVSEEPITTTCESLECYNNEKYNLECGCVENKCEWKKLIETTQDCPQFTPPAPDWCKDGKIIQSGLDENGCQQHLKCIKNKNKLKLNSKNESECPENCTCSGSTTKCNINGGREMTIRAGNSGNVIIQIKGENMSTKVILYHHNGEVYGNFKNNETKKIILPDEVREKIKEKTRTKLEKYNITLDEDGVYHVQAKKKARLFYLFPVKEKTQLQLNAENGEIIKIRNPWWGFLARDVEEE